jgi:hypothetical protein
VIKEYIHADIDENVEIIYRHGGGFEEPYNLFNNALVGITNKRIFKIENGKSYFTLLLDIVTCRHKKNNMFHWDKLIVTTISNQDVCYGIYYSDTIEYFMRYIDNKRAN